ncbi:hypothetical protein JZ751_000620 [Albula glossodonta]|uniref:Uncharacterized protein n=1 Tax=Albula glossodonta TaxID=121402 RepID=A0A8T2PWK9_9TELE|nr:hypothetical protein JZ751_000620 [Albula glossodonta]
MRPDWLAGCRVPTRQHEKPKVDAVISIIIGVVIGVLLLLVIIAAAIFMIHKWRQDVENRDGPPKYKSPPPTKNDGSTEMLNKSQDLVTVPEPPHMDHKYYETTGEPVTDLDANDEENGYTIGTATGCSESAKGPGGDSQSETLPPYSNSGVCEVTHNGAQDSGALSPSTHGGSFVSPAQWRLCLNGVQKS